MHDQKIYESNRSWSDATFPQGIPIIFNALGFELGGEWSAEIASFFEDTKKSTDIILVHPSRDPIRIAYRMRRERYMSDGFAAQFTMRDGNYSNVPTEYQKVFGEGAADIGIYGFVYNGNIIRWIILIFNNLRKVHSQDKYTGLYLPDKHIISTRGKNKSEYDTTFRAYDIISIKAHDDSILTNPEDRIILAHSPGYFNDINVYPPKPYMVIAGNKMPIVTMKDMIDRIDKY